MHNKYLLTDEWRIIEDSWKPEMHQASESLFSIGNGHMGQRANFEESYSGDSLQGSYIGGVYYPDKTRVGWWKNGYPEFFAKVLNSVNWIGIGVEIDGEELDFAKARVSEFHRELNMQEGLLKRKAVLETASGKKLELNASRFISMRRKDIGAIRYSIKPLNFSAPVKFSPYLDFDVVNEDSNYDEKFWDRVSERVGSQKGMLRAKTRKTEFEVVAAMRYELLINDEHSVLYPETEQREKYVANSFIIDAQKGSTYTLQKYAAIVSSLNYQPEELEKEAENQVSDARRDGYQILEKEQKEEWATRWSQADIRIKGDAEAQQGIRFNIFQLLQTYTGDDPRLNIGPKGFTGEKYGGSTYWDTEAYCLPFYMAMAGQDVARNLLIYRYNHLPKAIENAEKLGFSGGAALYPMVTMNGEESHNEWEITFEEIHRNGAIAYAIYNYTRYFNDEAYLAEYGLEVLIAIARFWAQRVSWSEPKQQFGILGVTGPNEYENNVNNNWYTNYIARWCLQYTLEVIEKVERQEPEALQRIFAATAFDRQTETARWNHVVEKMYLPADESLGIFLQQENYLDKEQRTAADLDISERPINQYWSWDRILRSCYIKQADTLQGMYFFREHFDRGTIQKNFDFYEPRTLHESSLSPCVHVVLAAYLNKMDKAYELYLRTSRLDLDDYNKEVHEGLHITSMAGTWLSVIEGFGGMHVENNELHFHPNLPEHWEELVFTINFRGSVLKVSLSKDGHQIQKLSGEDVPVKVDSVAVQPVS